MADIITGTTSGFVNNQSDNIERDLNSFRREAAKDFNDVDGAVRDNAYNNLNAVKDARFEINSRVIAAQMNADDRFFALGRDTQDVRAQVTAVGYQVRDGFAAAAKDAEINALKTQLDASKNAAEIKTAITAEGDATRALINRLRDDDLNRALVERNTELVAALDDGRRWRGRWDDGQYQSLLSQLQAFQSQLTTSKQDMINFGLMAGVGQSSTNNQVR